MKLHDAIPTDRFLALPGHAGTDSGARRCGVELEFAGLSVAQAADMVQALWGGSITQSEPRAMVLDGGRLGRVKVELDISLSKPWAEDLAAQALGDLVPVEIVTAPLPQADLPQVDALVVALRRAGGLGTQARLAYGFGLHLNPELPSPVGGGPDGTGLVAIACAYGLLEGWLRDSDPVDLARRVLPFIAPWPPALVDALVDAPRDVAGFAPLYVTHAPTRHHGLDLLPALEHLCPEALGHVPPEHLKGGRPAFHYRLPEARLDAPGWSVAYEWNRWVVVEAVAAAPDLLDALARAWAAHRRALLPLRRDWALEVEAILSGAELLEGLVAAPG